MIYGTATVIQDEDGFIKISSMEECDALAISKELFIMMINAINDGIAFKKFYQENYEQPHTDIA